MTERKRAIRIGNLDTLGGILKEMGAVYRQARRHEIDDVHAVRLVSILREMRTLLEVKDLETRLLALEKGSVVPFRKSA